MGNCTGMCTGNENVNSKSEVKDKTNKNQQLTKDMVQQEY
jgi:hypothetical protein